MKYKTDAYELEENPMLTRRVKVIMPNGNEAVMEYRQLLDEKGELEKNVTKIHAGYYQITKGNTQ